jgi:hypothetical protein
MKFAAKYLISPLIVLLCGATMAYASAVLTIPSSGTGTIAVQGTGLDKVASIDMQIAYNPATMTNLRVSPGGLIAGALLSANTSQTGTILISVVRKFPMSLSGSGLIAQISFDSPGGSSATITNFNAKLLGLSGVQLGAQAVIISVDAGNPQPDNNKEANQGSGNLSPSTDNPSPGSGSTPQPEGTLRPLGGGNLIIPSGGGEATGKGGKESAASETAATPQGGAEGATEHEAKAEPPEKPAEQPAVEKKSIVYKSVLEQFRVFKGERTPGALTSLFTAAAVPGVRQEPAIVLTDGSTKVKVSIELPSAGKDTPNFALSGAQMLSIRTEGSAWVVEVVPDKGVAQASITAMQGTAVTEIPLTVAPRVALNTGKNGIADEAAFARFLKERGSEKSPQFDLNGDGVRDYIDDYIYTANYLAQPVLKEKEPVKQMENGKKMSPANQKK